MNDAPAPRRSATLLVIAGLMTVTLAAVLVAAAFALNQNSFVAMFDAYAVDGTALWSVESEIDEAPVVVPGEILFRIHGEINRVTAAGEVLAGRDLRQADAAPPVVIGPNVGARWTEVIEDGSVTASVAELAELSTPTSVRYLQHGEGTIAVSADGGEVLWTDPDRFPDEVAERVALNVGPERYELVSGTTGKQIALVNRTDRSSATLSEGHLIVVNNGRIIVVDEEGNRTRVARVSREFRAKGASDRYAVVEAPTTIDTRRRVLIIDTQTGERLVNSRVRPVGPVLFDDNTVVLCHGAIRKTVIDLTTGGVGGESQVSCKIGQPIYKQVGAVFDSDRRRLLWDVALDGTSTIGVVDDTIVVVRVGHRLDGNVSYNAQ